jgi:DNA-binding beta-propeller fold protein YncE
MKRWIALAAGLLLPIAVQAEEPAPAGAAQGYHILKTASVPGDGGWDYLSVDAKARRLYIAHANSAQVLDADSLKLLGTVPGVKHPHGVLAVDAVGKGYASSGEPGSVVVFDLKTFKKKSEIKTSADCDFMLYDAATKNLFTFDGDSSNATVIDPVTDKVTGVIDLGGGPEAAVSDGMGLIYDNIEDKNEVVKIDSKAQKVLARWPTAPGESPTGIAFDSAHKRLFVGCRNKLLVIMDSESGKVLQSLPIGDHIDTTVFDAQSGTVFNSCGDGTLSVVQATEKGDYKVVEDAKTMPGARTMAFDSKTGHVYTDTADTKEPAKPDPEHPKHRDVEPGSFKVLVLGK